MRTAMTSNVKAFIAVSLLGTSLAVPVAAGVASCIVGPITRSSRPEWVVVTSLETLAADGTPREFPIVVTRFDAWSRLADEVIGYVYFRRTETHSQVLALRTTNHAGCTVEFNPEKHIFEDPCWGGRWDINGQRLHLIPEWGDLRPVGVVVRDDAVYVRLPDLTL